jgi:hypothetical protein
MEAAMEAVKVAHLSGGEPRIQLLRQLLEAVQLAPQLIVQILHALLLQYKHRAGGRGIWVSTAAPQLIVQILHALLLQGGE